MTPIYLFPELSSSCVSAHRYTFGILFGVATCTLAVILPLSGVRSPLLLAYGVIMLLLSLLRTIFYCAFPYERGSESMAAVTYVYGLGYPLLPTALTCLYFFVAEFVFRQMKARAFELQLRTKLVFFATCALEVAVQILSDSLRLQGKDWSWTVVCRAYLGVWGLAIAVGFGFWTRKLRKLAALVAAIGGGGESPRSDRGTDKSASSRGTSPLPFRTGFRSTSPDKARGTGDKGERGSGDKGSSVARRLIFLCRCCALICALTASRALVHIVQVALSAAGPTHEPRGGRRFNCFLLTSDAALELLACGVAALLFRRARLGPRTRTASHQPLSLHAAAHTPARLAALQPEGRREAEHAARPRQDGPLGNIPALVADLPGLWPRLQPAGQRA